MIVIGVDVHKQSVTAVVIDEAGRPLDEKTVPVGTDELIGWASAHGHERLWAVEDCRTLTGWIERQLLGFGEELVRVPPKLTVPERRAGRARGKSDPIDGLAIARAALREPDLPRPRAGERVYVEIKLLVDHRDDLVDECRRAQQRLRWHLFQLDPTYAVPLRLLARPSHSSGSVDGSFARSSSSRCSSHESSRPHPDAHEDDQRPRSPARAPHAENGAGATRAPGCGPATAAKLLAEIGPIDRFKNDAQLARHSGVAPLEASSGRIQRHRLDRGGNRQLNAALYRIAITQAHYHAPARAYLDRKRAEGKSRREAIRCLKRLLVRVVFQTLKASPALT